MHIEAPLRIPPSFPLVHPVTPITRHDAARLNSPLGFTALAILELGSYGRKMWAKTLESKRYRIDDGRQIASPYTSAPRGGGYHILCEHPDGFVPPRPGVVLLGICHASLGVSGCIMPRVGAWLINPSLTSTKHIMYNPAGAWPLTFPCSKYNVFLTFSRGC